MCGLLIRQKTVIQTPSGKALSPKLLHYYTTTLLHYYTKGPKKTTAGARLQYKYVQTLAAPRATILASPSSEPERRFQRQPGNCNPRAATLHPPQRPTDARPSPTRSQLGHRHRLVLPRKLLPAPPPDRSVQLHSRVAWRPREKAACCEGRVQPTATARHKYRHEHVSHIWRTHCEFFVFF